MYRIGGHLTWPSPWKHAVNIFAKLGLSVSESDNRRVLAVLQLLQS
jgi:hypothetical protein